MSIRDAGTVAPRAAWRSDSRTYVLYLLTAIYALNAFDRTIINVLLDPIKAEMKLTDTELGFIAGLGFALLYAVLGVPLARLADRTSRRVVIASGLLLWTIATATGGLARTGLQLTLTRTGVGIGEAAGTAPCYSMLSDYFPKAERPRALSIFSMGLPVGVFGGVLVGGWGAQLYGWRSALLIAGLPGLLAAGLLFFTVAERPVGSAEAGPADTGMDSMGATIRFLAGQRSYLFMLAGAFFAGFPLNALFVWVPSLLGRVHHLDRGAIGTYLAVTLGLVGLAGVYGGGWIVTRFGGTDDRWRAWEPAAACAVAFPAMLVMVLGRSLPLTLAGLTVGSACLQSLLGPLFSVYQNVAKVRMRAFATAVQNLMGTIGGLGIGSLVVGMLNDHLAPAYGAEAIRYSLLFPIGCLVPAALSFWWGSRFINADVARVG